MNATKLMNFFNFRSKSNNGLSAAEKKACSEFMQQERLSWPTLEEAVRVIVDEFKPEQLKKLEIAYKDGSPISFEKQLLIKYTGLYPKDKKQHIQETIKNAINKHEYVFDLPDTRVVFVFFKHELEHFFTSHYY